MAAEKNSCIRKNIDLNYPIYYHIVLIYYSFPTLKLKIFWSWKTIKESNHTNSNIEFYSWFSLIEVALFPILEC